MICSRLAVMLMLVLAGQMTVAQQNGDIGQGQYRIKPIFLPPEKRTVTHYVQTQLPFKDVGGDLPAYDGEQFQLNLRGERAHSATEAAQLLGGFLKALGLNLEVGKDLRLLDKPVPVADGLARYRFEQWLDDVPLENTAIMIVDRETGNMVSLQGRVYARIAPENTHQLYMGQALDIFLKRLKEIDPKLAVRALPDSASVLLPYGDSFRYAWRFSVMADVRYTVWLDAASGEILQLLPATPATGHSPAAPQPIQSPQKTDQQQGQSQRDAACSCSTTAADGNTSLAVLPALPMLALVAYRWRQRPRASARNSFRPPKKNLGS